MNYYISKKGEYNMTQFEQLDVLLNEYGGIIQTFQVIDNGISKPVFYSYVKERGLEHDRYSFQIFHYVLHRKKVHSRAADQ